ncbi:MAG: hypothetical protein J0L70_11320 [Leptolyngbya sp. UWPOB_LEPTO1]|uniref:hypothetical protein n=1 Tax=Leptolyngbya sp. UWPOB_LEPTO1 TaxID=2815653 RepID=UPI001ACACF43|nr:hypothetical protein [Leptolyngbya sp. UWPOB_LEPTO1]MBN8561106.1 hypothetical protein [Leptolyngbya sp. UWPOB_LEPTO1]
MSEAEPTKEEMIRFTADLPKSLHRRFSVYAAREGKDKVALLRQWLTEKLKDVES